MVFFRILLTALLTAAAISSILAAPVLQREEPTITVIPGQAPTSLSTEVLDQETTTISGTPTHAPTPVLNVDGLGTGGSWSEMRKVGGRLVTECLRKDDSAPSGVGALGVHYLIPYLIYIRVVVCSEGHNQHQSSSSLSRQTEIPVHLGDDSGLSHSPQQKLPQSSRFNLDSPT
ncbi:hypothetical protein EV359DRAFT_67883 [Lentinula novae-zelandiae]|nr:hypothetical protein EV359DRAFT_67883 [Lentinula novae-zelandiae]